MRFNRVLVLSPHTDDAELGAGGTIARFLEEGKEIYYLVFSDCRSSIPNGMPKDTLRKECFESIHIMGVQAEKVKMLDYDVRTFPKYRQEILEDLIRFKQEIKPDLVMVPSSHDMHQDHNTIYWESLRAFKKESSIWGYEHPWNNLTFTTDIFVRLNETHIKRKINALKQYFSQQNRSYMDEKNVISIACSRGSQMDVEYAEAFELIRLIY